MPNATYASGGFTRCFDPFTIKQIYAVNCSRPFRMAHEMIEFRPQLFSMRSLQLLTCLSILALTRVSVAQEAVQSTLPAIVGLAATAFSGSRVLHTAQLTGTATWHSGSLTDSGSVNLTASSAGSSKMELNLSSLGQRSESQSGIGESAICNWAGNDGAPHVVGNCWRSLLWFLPLFSLQPSLIPTNQEIFDLGNGTVGTSTTTYRHVKSQFIEAGSPDAIVTEFTAQSAADLGLDPSTYLPATLVYSQHPDNGAPASIQFEIHFSDYRPIGGVQIPFRIQRFVNGSLQLDIIVDSAQIN